MKIKREVLITVVALAALLAGCGGGGGGGGDTQHSPNITSGTWAWMSGATTTNQTGVYGTKGASNAPGAREGSVSWTDASGDRWLFGGYGFDSTGPLGYLNDLWKFDGANWIWVSGAFSRNQAGQYPADHTTCDGGAVPGSRKNAVSWTDSSGNLWLFGGYGSDWIGAAGWLNDLWKFDPVSDCWTWVSGAKVTNQTGSYGIISQPSDTNVPGARENAVSWTDASGNLWLFGGYGVDSVNLAGGYLNDLWKFNPVTSQWTWVSGANTRNQHGVYGAADPADNVPGSRSYSASWTDSSGTLWLFGGVGYDSATAWPGRLNDLWKFDQASGNWTMVKGADTIDQAGTYVNLGETGTPGARGGSAAWTDTSGDLWLFGGYGFDSDGVLAYLNDLWKFDGTNWTWVSGANTVDQTGVYGTKGQASSSNVPGARAYSASWTDSSGDLWLFGGSYGAHFNDLWKFDGANWTWVSGANTVDQKGAYGTRGAANIPGAREGSVSWTGTSGSLWLFGGFGRDSAGAQGNLNDLWKFDGANWTWVSGADIVNQQGVYGVKGAANPGNVPGARSGSVSWTDASGDLWLFGGYGYDWSGTQGYLNDLWKFDGANWTWMSGADIVNQQGVYGTKGAANPANVPGSRTSSVSWIDASGDLWLFGGYGYDKNGQGRLNDLWKFDGTNWTWVSGADTVGQVGIYGTKGVADTLNVPGAHTSSDTWTDTNGNLWLFGGWGPDSAGVEGHLNELWKFDGANWTWVSGANTNGQAGIYGTKGVASSSNVPGARDSSVPWIDASGNLWLFGGSGVDSAGAQGDLNDLWRFTPQ